MYAISPQRVAAQKNVEFQEEETMYFKINQGFLNLWLQSL